jgi:hypothetical protein
MLYFLIDRDYLNGIINTALYEVVVTPHLMNMENAILSNKSPNLVSISKTGHINSDFVLWNHQAIPFLKWQAKIHETECIIKDGVFLDQTWLNFLPCFTDTYWLRSDIYNAAYWRNLQKDFVFMNDIPFINEQRVVAFQFSGFVKGDPGKISKHCNYPRATGDYLKFLEWYDKKI